MKNEAINWISVNQATPTRGCEVLVYNSETCKATTGYFEDGKWNSYDGEEESNEGLPIISHWAFLPDPPQHPVMDSFIKLSGIENIEFQSKLSDYDEYIDIMVTGVTEGMEVRHLLARLTLSEIVKLSIAIKRFESHCNDESCE